MILALRFGLAPARHRPKDTHPTLRVYESVGHLGPEERKRRYENDTLAFLDERFGGLSCMVGQKLAPRAKKMR